MEYFSPSELLQERDGCRFYSGSILRVLKKETEEPRDGFSILNLTVFPPLDCKRWLEAAAALSSLQMLLIPSAPDLLLLLAAASSSRKSVFVFLMLRRAFIGQIRVEEPRRCLLLCSSLLHLTSCMLGLGHAHFLSVHLHTGWFL